VLFDIDNDDQDGSYTVAWSAVAGADFYRLEQNLNDTTWETVYEGPASSKSRSAMPPGIYCYRVRALNANTYSPRSTVKCATVSSYKPPQLPAPTLFDIENADQDGSYTVAWSAVAGADYYKVKQNLNDTAWDTLYEGPALSKNLSNMAPGEYCYRVRAFNATAYSEWSEVKCTNVAGDQPPALSAPLIADIENGDQDGSYTVAWSAVAGADYYKVKQNLNNTTWDNLYEGPALSKSLSNMAPGEYCYRVRAFNTTDYSEWSAVKCTTVAAETKSDYVCEFETLFAGPRTFYSDVEMLFDGRLIITQTADNEATIFDPRDRSFTPVDLPQGGGSDAAVLATGTVLYTLSGPNSHSIIYNPNNGEIEHLDTSIVCLGVYNYYAAGWEPYGLMTYCGDNRGYLYPDIYANWHSEYEGNIEIQLQKLSTYILDFGDFRGYSFAPVTNGIVSTTVFIFDGDVMSSSIDYDHRGKFDLPDFMSSTISYDKSAIYFSGGSKYLDPGYEDTVAEAYMASLPDETFKQIADMLQDRSWHAMLGLFDGSLIVLGGYKGDWYYSWEENLSSIERYVPAENKWYRAGSLNIARKGHKAIQLLTGEIFVYGGWTDPGPGYAYIGPPEIGRCEKANNN
jgi:hypothetical protein